MLGHSQGPGACLVGRGRAGTAERVWCGHPGGGTAEALGPAAPSLFPPEQPLGRGSATLSTSCPAGPLPTAIRGVAVGQAGQVACRPGVGRGPNYVSEGQPGSASSSCRAGDPLQGSWTLQGDSGSTAFSFPLCPGLKRLGPNCPSPMVPTGGTSSLTFSSEHPSYHSSQAPRNRQLLGAVLCSCPCCALCPVNDQCLGHQPRSEPSWGSFILRDGNHRKGFIYMRNLGSRVPRTGPFLALAGSKAQVQFG